MPNDTSAQPVRTVIHISPAVSAAAIVCAQRTGLRMQEWLDKIVIDACAAQGAPQAGSLTDEMTIELFAHIANYGPGLLTGRWKLLFERVRIEDDLLDYPSRSMIELEEDPEAALPTLNLERLRQRWPRLLAAAFAM